MKVLIAEDDNTSRLVLQKTVQKLGHECIAATDGEEAWRLFRSAGADVVISDWMMPGISGAELCQRIRSSDDSYTYFIFLTALDSRESLLEGMRLGADDYLTKPFDRYDLEARLLAAARVTALHVELRRQQAELQRINIELYDTARRDPLTQLANRLRLQEDLEQLRARSERYGHSYGVAICDIDYFKLYNDHYGHLAGDAVLKDVAGLLAEHCRTGDAIYRYGGEEFLILLPEQPLPTATYAVERMRRGVEARNIPHRAGSPFHVVTVSAGLAELPAGSTKSVSCLLDEADKALYHAKRTGKNKVVPFGPELKSQRPAPVFFQESVSGRYEEPEV